MKINWKLFPMILVLMFLTLGCSSDQGTPNPAATIVVDAACRGMVGHSFVSSVSYLLGESDQGPVYGPHMISFLSDGRAVWKYSMESYIGTYTCENAQIKATFTEGTEDIFEGTYFSESEMVRADKVDYLMATEQ